MRSTPFAVFASSPKAAIPAKSSTPSRPASRTMARYWPFRDLNNHQARYRKSQTTPMKTNRQNQSSALWCRRVAFLSMGFME